MAAAEGRYHSQARKGVGKGDDWVGEREGGKGHLLLLRARALFL